MLDQRYETNPIIDRKDSCATFKLASPPIFVSSINNFNDIAFFQCQLSCFDKFDCTYASHNVSIFSHRRIRGRSTGAAAATMAVEAVVVVFTVEAGDAVGTAEKKLAAELDRMENTRLGVCDCGCW